MRNFVRLATGVDVAGLGLLIAQKTDLWNVHRLRKDYPDSPHVEIDDIWLRWNKVDHSRPEKVVDELDVLNYPGWYELPQARQIVLNLMRAVECDRLGRVMITRLAPGGRIGKHMDQGGYAGYYKRYHVAIQVLPGALFACGDEQVQMLTGEVWWFNAYLPHEVANNSADDRITMIVDMHPL